MVCFVGCGGGQNADATSGSTKTGRELVLEKFKELPVPTKARALQVPQKEKN
jgi:hypothetical protein